MNNSPLPAALPPLTQTDTYIFWSSNEAPGWMHLLPPLSGARLLCVDASGAVVWALARECRQLTLLHCAPSWPIPTLEMPDAGAMPLQDVELDTLLAAAASPGFEPYDGLVIHDPQGRLLHRSAQGLLQRLLNADARVLSERAWAYVGATNPHSLQRWRDRLRGTTATPGTGALPLRTLLRLLRSSGAKAVRVHPCLTAHGRVAEVLPAGGYRATKNREARSERVKEWLFGPRGARHLAPAFGLLALRDPTTTTMLDQLVARVGGLRAGTAAARGAPGFVMKQYLVFPGHKAIVSVGPADRDDQDVIAVLTADAVSTRGRNLEQPHLAALARIPAIAPSVPRMLDQFTAGQVRCHVMERIPGVTLDQDLAPLEQVTDEALQFLVRLHCETAVPMPMQDMGFDRLVLPLLDAASERNPDFAGRFVAWRAPLHRALAPHVIPAVYQHGDFKVENVIYEPGTGRLLSVIDWEHARRPGLPVLDLLYLLVYNRIIRGAHWTDAVEALIVRGDWNAPERLRLQRYMDALALPADLLPALRALFLAHHIGCRIHLPPQASLRAKVDNMLVGVGEVLLKAPISTPAVTS